MLGWHFVLVTLYRGLHLVLGKTIRIGDTIIFSVLILGPLFWVGYNLDTYNQDLQT